MVFSWNILLAKYGCEISKQRSKFIDEINKRITDVYRSIADNEDEVNIIYQSQVSNVGESEYLKKIDIDFERDKIIGHTGFGIHRDDYIFEFNQKKADGSASRGEVRSIVLALKFIEANLIFNKLNKRPVVLLDDVFSELDDNRQKCLVKNFKDNQVIITSTKEI
jgi:DNA replication and repair protein RecF